LTRFEISFLEDDQNTGHIVAAKSLYTAKRKGEKVLKDFTYEFGCDQEKDTH